MIAAQSRVRIFRPINNAQAEFLRTSAYETLIGGAAGGGKSLCLVIGAMLELGKRGYNAALVRRTYPELEGADGLIAVSRDWYPYAGGTYNESKHIWTFRNGETIRFLHMANRYDYYRYQGSQLQYIGFDELSHFEEEQYLYMFSRVRTVKGSGIRTRVVASSNPGSEWVKRRWAPWVDRRYPNPAKPGELRWFRRAEDGAEVECDSHEDGAWSRTYIPMSWADNPALTDEYRRNLDMLPYIQRQRLKYGDWDIVEGSGLVLNRQWFQFVDSIPRGLRAFRYWDFAATERSLRSSDPDYTATAVLYTDSTNYYIYVQRRRATWATVREWVRSCIEHDPDYVIHGGEEEGGASGKAMSHELMGLAARYGRSWTPVRPDRDKVQRAQQWSALAEQGRVYLLRLPGANVDDFLAEAHMFPDGAHDDMIDAVSGAFELWRRYSAASAPIVGTY